MKFLKLCLLILLNVIFIDCHCQNGLSITRPEMTVTNNKLLIKYDIKNTQPDNEYYVWPVFTDSYGNILEADSLYGDVGSNVTGGNSKQMLWDTEKDEFVFDGEILVKIHAIEQSAYNTFEFIPNDVQKAKRNINLSATYDGIVLAQSLYFTKAYFDIYKRIKSFNDNREISQEAIDLANDHMKLFWANTVISGGTLIYGLVTGISNLSADFNGNYPPNLILTQFISGATNGLFLGVALTSTMTRIDAEGTLEGDWNSYTAFPDSKKSMYNFIKAGHIINSVLFGLTFIYKVSYASSFSKTFAGYQPVSLRVQPQIDYLTGTPMIALQFNF